MSQNFCNIKLISYATTIVMRDFVGITIKALEMLESGVLKNNLLKQISAFAM